MNTNVRTPLQRVLSSLLCVAMLLSVLVMPIGATGMEPVDEVVSETAEPQGAAAETMAPEESKNAVVSEESATLLADAHVPQVVPSDSVNAIVKLFNYDDTVNTRTDGLGPEGYVFFHGDYVKDDDTDVTEGSVDGLGSGENSNNRPKLKGELVNGYPYVTGPADGIEVPIEGSMEYLFSDTIVDSYHKGTMSNGGGLFQYGDPNDEIDDGELEGYYYYDSGLNSAYFDGTSFTLYDTVIRPYYTKIDGSDIQRANFLPFNKIEDAVTVDTTLSTGVPAAKLKDYADLWFGMTVEFEFFMPKDGMMNGEEMVFDFHGDDDVFVYIDDVLILDIIGTHASESATINFATGATKDPRRGENTLGNLFKDVEGAELDGDTFKDYTKHTLKFFYMERGGNISYCRLKFNMPILDPNTLMVGKELTVEGTGSSGEAADFVQNSLKYKFRVWKSDDEGKPTDELYVIPGTEYNIVDSTLTNVIGTGYVDADGFFELKPGQFAKFTDMLVKGDGDIYYVVEEVLPAELRGQYGDVEFEVSSSASGKVEADTGEETSFSSFYTGKISAESSQIVTFNNPVVIDELGTLKITKTGENVDADKEFRMQVKLGGELLPVGTTYKVGEETRTVTTAGIIPLKVGETAVLEKKILSGSTFEVVELLSADEKFEVTYSGTITDAEGNVTELIPGAGVSGTFGLSNTVAITVNNKTVPVVVEIPVEKTAEGNTKKESATFTFVADQIAAMDDETVVAANAATLNITIRDDAPTAGLIRLTYGADTEPGTYYYKIYEKAGSENYIYDTNYYIVEITIATGDEGLTGSVTGIWKNGEGENLSVASFVNRKLATIIVHKNVLGIQTEDDFAFDIADTAFELNNGETYTAEVVVGTEYEISEDARDYAAYVKEGTNPYAPGNSITVTAIDGIIHVYFTNAKFGENDTVVIDYGLPVEVDVLANDLFPEDVAISLVSGTGIYGSASVTETNKVRYQFTVDNSLTMDNVEKFTYQAVYTPIEGCETTFDAELTIIPATSIYYEDSFVTLKSFDAVTEDALETHAWTQVGETDEDAVQAEDRPGEAISDLDADNLYGYDQAYTNYATYSGGSAMMTHVWNTTEKTTGDDGKTVTEVTDGIYSTAEFTFKGTGFDVVSMTTSKTGLIVVSVEGEGYSKNFMVDTYYGYKYEDGQWIVDKDDADSLYQIPVMKVVDLPYGAYNVKITATFHELFDEGAYTDENGNTGYDFYLDAIRIYDPANDGAGNEEIEDAYVSDGEGWPEYFELRNLILAAESFNSLGETVEGIVFIDGIAENASIADYRNYGPNNEIYLAANQSIAFDMDFEGFYGVKEIAGIQIGVKLAQGEPVAKICGAQKNVSPERQIPEAGVETDPEEMTIDVNTATDLYYEITHLDGKTVVITNTGEGILSITNIKVTFTGKDVDNSIDVPGVAISVDAGTAEAALTLLGAGTFPGEPEPEEFVPGKLEVSTNKDTIKTGEQVNVTVTTSADVSYITVNGVVITKYTANRRTGERTWKTTVSGDKAGELEITVAAFNSDSVESEPVVKTVTVESKNTSGNGSAGGWKDLFKGFFGGNYGRFFGGWFN